MNPPPTPTLLPVPEALPIDMPSINAWDFAPNAIQGWNSFGEVVVVFQAIVLLGLIMFILMALYRYAKIISVVRND